MDPLHIVLIVLVIAAIWAVVELALTIKKARTSIDEVTRSANDTIEQLQPIISKADGIVDDLQPSVKQVTPLLESAIKTVDTATVSLEQASGVVDTAANAAVGLVNKITGKAVRQPGIEGADPAKLTEGAVAAPAPAPKPDPAPAPRESGYVTYAPKAAEAPADEEPAAGRHSAVQD